MKKLICLVMCLVIFALMLPMNPYAAVEAEQPLEIPEVSFVVNGAPMVLSDVPLGINGRTMLPLRAVLVALGVPDDDGHIKWNGEDGSVTVNHNETNVYLKLESKTAYINGVPCELDAPPFGYSKNSRIYIPVRFIAKAMGKEAAWDGQTRTVYLRDEGIYKEISAILDKTEKAMKAAVKAKIDTQMVMAIVNQGEESGFEITVKEQQDRAAGILHTEITVPVLNANVTFNNFYKDNTEYSNSMASGKWRKTAMEEKDFKKLFDNEMSLMSLNNMEVLAATLNRQENGKPEEIMLEGKVYPRGVAENLAVYSGLEALEISESYVEIAVDSASGLLKTVCMKISGRYKAENRYSDVSAEIKAVYSDINGSFEIILPNFEGTASSSPTS